MIQNLSVTCLWIKKFYNYCLISLFLLSLPTILSLLFLTAPYGKHHRPGWGPALPPPLAWFVMESPNVWLTLRLFRHGRNPRALLLISAYLLHYLHRTIVYPLRLFLNEPRREIKKPSFPASVAAMAFAFNLLNAYQDGCRNTAILTAIGGSGGGWGIGAAVNIWSDNLLPQRGWGQPSDGFMPGRGFGRGGIMPGGRGFGRGQGGFEKKTPPQCYICHRCKVLGHFIQHCPTNGDPGKP